MSTSGARREGVEHARPSREVAPSFAFELPAALAAAEPPEARGLARDAVRLMVSRSSTNVIAHARFRDLPDFLAPGDVVVVNTSATIKASLDAWRRPPGQRLAEKIELHLSAPLARPGVIGSDDRHWVVELRRLAPNGSAPLRDARAGEVLALVAGATATLVEPFGAPAIGGARLWVADLQLPSSVLAFAERHGAPIRYPYVRARWPLTSYQTVFATEPGSAEMPSAGRAFTQQIVERLERKEVRVVPVVLHTGVASLESNEPPYPERYRVPASTASAVNRARVAGRRVVAVGTTVVRALETVTSPDRRVRAGEGWTDVVVTPERGVFAVDALITGFHEPKSTHLAMLEALAGREHVARAYRTALECRYLWHEFGDVHLLLAE